MTQDELNLHSRSLAIATLLWSQARGADRDETVTMASNALIEVLGQSLGSVFAVVERLRDLADICERQAFDEEKPASRN